MRHRVLGPFVVLAAVLADQVTKLWVETSLPWQEAVPVLPFLSWFRTYNTGIAFSLLSSLSGEVMIALTGAILLAVLWLWWAVQPPRLATTLGFALIAGGAIGNLVDRVVLGHVVDFILFHVGNWSFAVFNLADSCITIGAALIILDEIASLRRPRPASGGGTK